MTNKKQRRTYNFKKTYFGNVAEELYASKLNWKGYSFFQIFYHLEKNFSVSSSVLK